MTGNGDDGDSCSRVQLAVDYFQYYVYDPGAFPELVGHEKVSDGVISALGTGAVISSGVRCAHVPVEVRVLSHAPASLPGEDVVAAECDLELPTGVVVVNGWDDVAVRHDFGHRTRCRMRVEVFDRDSATDAGTDERQRITLWEPDRPAPRWRSAADDELGRGLTYRPAPGPVPGAP